MNHRVAMRAAQDHALRDSLAGSSFSALTLVVLTLVWIALFAPQTRVIDVPIWDPGPGDVDDYDPIPEPPAGGGGADVPPADHLVVPVDEADAESTLVDEPLIAGSVGDPAIGDEPGIRGSFDGGGGGAPNPAVIPPPDEYIVHDELPRVAHKVVPEYPDVMRAAGMEGRVLVRIFVGVDGKVHRAEIEGKPSVFDEKALVAVRQWVFTPAKSNGHPVAVWMRIPVVFRLD